MYKQSVGNHFPSIYKNFKEIDELIVGEDTLFTVAAAELDRLRANQFVNTAYEEALFEYEKMLGIYATSSETLSFRRDRILNRLKNRPPFSLPFLRQKLNEIIGVDAYTISMDYATYTLTIESAATDQSWFHEIAVTINRIKPVNIIYVSKANAGNFVNTGESISQVSREYNYILGSWKLGEKSFATYNDLEVKKLSSVLSIKDTMLHDMALGGSAAVAKVLINDTLSITSFDTKGATGNTAIIVYTVINGSVSEITNIKLLDSGDNILTESNVYIPIIQDMLISHKILMKEGE